MIRLVAFTLILTTSALAAPARTTQAGQLVCRDRDELRDAVQAIFDRDGGAFNNLSSCVVMKRGGNFVVLKDEGRDDHIHLRIIKVRVMAPEGEFAGYKIDTQPRPRGS